jgi:hypothetical protein
MRALAWSQTLTSLPKERKAEPVSPSTQPDPVELDENAQAREELNTEWELVRRAQSFDNDAIHQLYEKYFP